MQLKKRVRRLARPRQIQARRANGEKDGSARVVNALSPTELLLVLVLVLSLALPVAATTAVKVK